MKSSSCLALAVVCLLALALAGPAWATDCHFAGAFYSPPAVIAPVIAPAALVTPAVAQVQVQVQTQAVAVAQPVVSTLAVTGGYSSHTLAVAVPVVSTLAVTGGYSSHTLAVAVPVVRQRVFAVRGIHGGLSGARLVGRRPAIVVRGRGLAVRSAPAVIIRSRR